MIAVLSLIDLGAIGIVGLVVIIGLFRTGRRIELKVGNVEAKVDTAAVVAKEAANIAAAAARTVDEVNRAVNNRPPNDPTLYEQVRRISLKVDDLQATTHRVDQKCEEIGVRLTAHLAHHQAQTDSEA